MTGWEADALEMFRCVARLRACRMTSRSTGYSSGTPPHPGVHEGCPHRFMAGRRARQGTQMTCQLDAGPSSSEQVGLYVSRWVREYGLLRQAHNAQGKYRGTSVLSFDSVVKSCGSAAGFRGPMTEWSSVSTDGGPGQRREPRSGPCRAVVSGLMLQDEDPDRADSEQRTALFQRRGRR